MNRRGINRRGRVLTAGAVVVVVAVAGCGGQGEHVAVRAGPTTTAPASVPTTTTTAPVTTTVPASVTTSAGVCTPAELSADQVPLSSGTGTSALAWSLTDTGTQDCLLPAGQPTLSFVGSAGTSVAHYTVTHLAGGAGAAVRLRPGRSAWFVTEETATGCGVGATLTDGPFHYELGLPGVSGTVTWAPAFLAGRTLEDFCADAALSVGDLQASRPTGPS